MSVTISPDAAAFLDLMPLTITIEPPVLNGSGEVVYDAYGAITYGAAKSYRCYIENDSRLITAASGQEVVSGTHCYVYPVATDSTPLLAVNVKARITLPDGRQPVVLDVDGLNDETGGIVAWVIHS